MARFLTVVPGGGLVVSVETGRGARARMCVEMSAAVRSAVSGVLVGWRCGGGGAPHVPAQLCRWTQYTGRWRPSVKAVNSSVPAATFRAAAANSVAVSERRRDALIVSSQRSALAIQHPREPGDQDPVPFYGGPHLAPGRGVITYCNSCRKKRSSALASRARSRVERRILAERSRTVHGRPNGFTIVQ